MYGDFSKIYEERISEDFDHRKCADFLKKTVMENGIGFKSVLDSGCGSGKFTVFLMDLFREVTAIDPSEEMLMLAGEKFKGLRRPTFIIGKSQNFKSSRKYDVITAVLDVPNYFKDREDIKKFLKNSWNNLNDNSLLIFDISSPHKLETVMGNNIFTVDEDDYFHVWENRIIDKNGEKYTSVTINSFIKDDGNGSYTRITEDQEMMHIDPEFIVTEAEKTGFIVSVKSGYTDKTFEKDSDRAVFILRKVHNG